MQSVRDANIEIKLLLRGPLKDFQDTCSATVAHLAPNFDTVLRELFLDRTKELGSKIRLSGDFGYTGSFECPFPAATQTVKQAVEMVLAQHAPNAIYVNAKFIDAIVTELNQLGEQKHKPLAETSLDKPGVYSGIQQIASQLASKPDLIVQHIGVYVYQSEAKKRPEPLINCAFHTHIFKPIVPDTLNDLRILVQINGGSYCLDLQAGDEKYLQSAVGIDANFLRGYFSNRVRLKTGYSRQEAADTEPRNWRDWQTITDPMNDPVLGDYGNALNEPGGFDFPALTARMYDIGDLTVENAGRKLNAEYDEFDTSWEIFGVKLPGRLFIGASIATLTVSYCVVIWATRQAGKLALSDVIQDLPTRSLKAAVFAIVAVAPAVGLLFAATRMRYATSLLFHPIQVVAITWFVLSSIGVIKWIFPAVSRPT